VCYEVQTIMPIPAVTIQRELLADGRRAIQRILDDLSRVPVAEVEALCQMATATADHYCDEYLARFVEATQPATVEDVNWIKGQYLALLLELASAIRDVMTESSSRHAVAQKLQCKILEQERQLRVLLRSVSGEVWQG
jgi:hypothetical protein